MKIKVIPLIIGLIIAQSTIASGNNLTKQDWAININFAGKQRMMTQKMTKEAILVFLDIDKVENLNLLAETAKEFNLTLLGLKYGNEQLKIKPTGDERINHQIGRITKLWGPFYSKIKSIVHSNGDAGNEELLYFLADNNQELLKQVNRVVRLMEKSAVTAGLEFTPNIAATLNLSDKQLMLTQKLAKEFLLIKYGYKLDTYKKSLHTSYTIFNRTLIGLKQGDDILEIEPLNIKDTNLPIEEAQTLWDELKPDLVNAATGNQISKADCHKVAKLNLELLNKMNQIVKALNIYVNMV